MPKKSATSFDDNISYVKQTLRAKAERRNPGQSERASGSSTAALENKVAKLYEAMQKQSELSQQKLAEVQQEAEQTKRTLANTRDYLSKKEELEEANASAKRSQTSREDDDQEDLAKSIKEKEEDDKLVGDKEPEDSTELAKTVLPPMSFDDFLAGSAQPAAETPATPTPEEEVSKVTGTPKKLNLGEIIRVGGANNIKITNLFGIRTGQNSVPGREGKHSKGVDYVGFSEDGTSNVPVVVADGTIINIGLDGDGKAISPTRGAALGYYADVKVETASGPKVFRYGHLGPSLMKNKEALLNKPVVKGEALYPKPPEGYVSTGSITGPHVKLQVSSLNGSTVAGDFENNDPSDYL